MKTRLALFAYRQRVLLGSIIAVWLVVLCVPQLRLIFNAHTARQQTYSPPPPWAENNYGESNELTPIQRWPHDRDVQIADAETDGSGDRYEKLLRTQPNNLLLIASRLKNSQVNDTRLEAFSDPTYAARTLANARATAAITAPPAVPPTSIFPTKTEDQRIALLITLARRGHKLEPNNVYFAQILMYLLFCAGRNDEAVRVLDAPPTRPFYNDYTREIVAACMRANEKMRTLIVEEKEVILYSYAIFPHIAKMREACQGLIKAANDSEKSGNKLHALHLRYETLRIGTVVLRDSDFSITAMVGSAQIATALRRPNVAYLKLKKSWPDELTVSEFAQRMKPVRDDFRQFSLSLKRADIAHRADNAAKQHIAFYAARQRYLQESDNDFISVKIWLLNAFSYATLMQLGGFVAAFGLVSFLLGRAPHIAVASRQTWGVVALTAAFCVAAFFAAYSWNEVKDGGMHMDEPISGLGIYGLNVFTFAPFVLVPLLAGLVAWRKVRPTQVDAMTSSTRTTPSLLSQRFYTLCLLLWWSVPIYITLCAIAGVVSVVFGLSLEDVYVPLLGEFDLGEWMFKLLAVVLSLAALSGLWHFLRAFWFGNSQKTWRFNYAMRLCAHVWIHFILLSSIFWLLFAVVSLPERVRSEHKIQTFLQHGETWMAMNR